jgi:signal transduction histidine kinase
VVNLTKEKVLIRISDDGEGIENKISLGFLSVFYRVKKWFAIRRRFWIRLAIVKHIIEQGKNIRGERIRRRLRIFFTLAKQTGNKQKRPILVV